MASSTSFLFCYLITCICLSHATADDGRKAYIVYMGSLPSGVEYTLFSHHLNVLQSVLDGSISPENSIIRSYTNSFNGFAARLTEAEKERLVRLKGIVSVFPDRILKLQTTRSWDFSGLPLNVERRKTIESDIIIGVLDSGIWPESESFKDDGFGPIPKKWKGDCPKSFSCNKKLIGARGLLSEKGGSDPRDYDGHGTHTASTAAGSIVNGASFFGVANGSARGAVPSSRIAAYKVCNAVGCSESAILGGFDNAIKDGVDIITISIGAEVAAPLDGDAIAIGAFHAFDKGILTVQSAGNSGSNLGTTTSVAPWLFSVAASTIDRRVASKTILGNGKTLIGNSINSDKLKDGYSLVYGKDASSSCSSSDARSCLDSCLDSKLVQGKIVLCDDSQAVNVAKAAGAVASIIPSELKDTSFIYPLPASSLDTKDYEEVVSYYNHSRSANVSIRPTESFFDSAAPTVAEFSSRGPNEILTDILKPDITAPGVDILAAYSPKASPSDEASDKRSVHFSIISGTSMACPHVTGASAYVKSFQPTWSPSAIKSALVTTARPLDSKKDPDAEFAYGAGHVDPVKALNPGLVYETNTDDYVSFFCKLGYDANKIKLIVGRQTTPCPKGSQSTSSPVDVNYPTLSSKINRQAPYSVVFHRTVTNVGNASSTYKAIVPPNPKIEVRVEPSVLSFMSLNEKKSFKVTVTGKGSDTVPFRSSSLTWIDGSHRVRSPIVIYG